MNNLSDREKQLLLAIINEFIDSSVPVGSSRLKEKLSLNVSPATIRNIMAELVDKGMLAMTHSSSGRVPTTEAFKYFLEEISGEFPELEPITRETIKTNLYNARTDIDELIRISIESLQEISGNATIAIVNRKIYYAGLSDMLNIPEFQEIDKLRSILGILEDYSKLSEIFNKDSSDKEVKVLFGKETGITEFHDYAVVFSEIRLFSNTKGYIAVIGPNRIPYSKTIPALGFISRVISQVVKGW